jgi:hypothetical protein
MSAPARTSVRQALALGALLLLALPFRAVVAQTREKIAEWQLMRVRNRQPEDAGTDSWYRRLAADVPDRATIGLVLVDPSMSAADRNRTMFFVAYSLAPRPIVMTPDAPWVIVSGPIDPAAPTLDPRAFVLVRTFPPELRLFRRVAP